MYYFFHTPREKMQKTLRIIFGGFWCGIVNICNKTIILVPKKTKEKHAF
jgi:hypothetical protein